MEYFPQKTPSDPKSIPSFLGAELERLRKALAGAWNAITFVERNVAPTKVSNGDVAYADGSNWQSSRGLYVYVLNAWEKILTSSGLRISEGANKKMGVATLVAGTITVSNTSVAANSRIFLSRATAGGTLGHLSCTVSAGASFTINSSSGTDTSTVNWLIIDPA